MGSAVCQGRARGVQSPTESLPELPARGLLTRNRPPAPATPAFDAAPPKQVVAIVCGVNTALLESLGQYVVNLRKHGETDSLSQATDQCSKEARAREGRGRSNDVAAPCGAGKQGL